jgi:HTH-type transcriptional regulator/antitoxin HipB
MKARNLKQLGAALKNIRKSKMLTQGEVAKRAGIRQATISEIENGKRSFTDLFTKICVCLETELEFVPIQKGAKVFDPERFIRG